MTIDVTIPQETDSLIRPLQRTFYPTKIPEQHHQLKNFISVTDQNILYYASEHEIFALHLSTRKRELIASLPWKPQCLDAGQGWICVGGSENGRCAFICLFEENANDNADRALYRHAEVDALLPLDLDPESRILAHDFLQHSQTLATPARRRKPEIQFHEVGDSIVNSVTIHRQRSDQNGFTDDVVAVLTNNDQKVRIFSLTQSRVLNTVEFPTLMNHATISPEGTLMVAVGDEPQAFFCRRTPLPSLRTDGEPSFLRYEWQKIAEPKLSVALSLDACFSTAFSPSGHICAVASQTGVITIFDTSMIQDDMDPDDAVLDVFRSSRPCIGRDLSGAVRSMSFSPSPWDLLAWAEDQGRVCVIDLRAGFRSRQTIELETDSPSLTRVIMSDLEESHNPAELRQLEIEARFVQRHREALDAQDHFAAVSLSHAADYMELAAERRRIERETRGGGSLAAREELNSLTESERQILDTIPMNRIQENEQARADNTQQSPFSVNYLQLPGDQQADSQNSSSPSTSLSHSQNAPQSSRGTGSIHDYMRQRNMDRNRPGDRSYQPRRRSSVVLSNGNPSNSSNSSHPSSLAPIGTATPTISASPSRLPSSTETTSTASTPASGDAWQPLVESLGPVITVDASAARLRAARDTAFARTLDRRVQQQQLQAARLERVRNTSANMQRLRQLHGMTVERARAVEHLYDDHELDMLRRIQETRGRRNERVGTMGVGWSRDGRNLYVATEEGILEYTVNLDERKTFPGWTLQ